MTFPVHKPDKGDLEVRKLLSEILTRCGKKHFAIAEKMGITVARLDSWCSTAVEKRTRKGPDGKDVEVEARRPMMPVARLRSFCKATGCDELRAFFLTRLQRRRLKLIEDGEDVLAAWEAFRRRKRK